MSATDIATSVDVDLDLIYEQTKAIAEELINTAAMKPGQILVVGCSSSEIAAHAIGCYSSSEVGQAVFTALSHVTKKHGLYLAAQCCEHLNRALIVEEECAAKYGLEMVNVKPQLKAGGSFSTAAWSGFEHPCAVEFIKAHAGIDIGDTLIGMHLRHVAVPVRTTIKSIGSAHVVCARTRLKYIGDVDPNANLTYGVDFDLGDLCTYRYADVGIETTKRITEIQEVYEGSKQTLSVVFGNDQMTSITKIIQREVF